MNALLLMLLVSEGHGDTHLVSRIALCGKITCHGMSPFLSELSSGAAAGAGVHTVAAVPRVRGDSLLHPQVSRAAEASPKADQETTIMMAEEPWNESMRRLKRELRIQRWMMMATFIICLLILLKV
jgi:hypothetical protein